MTSSTWKETAESKKQSVDELIPKEWRLPDNIKSKFNETTPVSVLALHKTFGILSEKEVKITESFTAKELLNKIADKDFTSLEVATAFCKRAAIATQLTNCCTELLFNEALGRAKWLDHYLESNGHVLGPLHGLPMSLKDSHNIKGFDSTIGYVSFIGNRERIKDDAAIYKVLTKLGAIVHVKTNIPTTLMTADSENNIFGRTLNPNNLTLTAGGSSGGEGSFIKQRGALIGIGTDIAGSIRIPSLCNGIYGFRPSICRFPFEGNTEPTRWNFASPVLPVAGPMAYDMESLNPFMNLILNDPSVRKYDPDLLSIPWNNTMDLPDKIKVGVVSQCDSIPLQPQMERIIKEAVEKLKNCPDFEIIYLEDFPSFTHAWEITCKYFLSDPGDESFSHIEKSGEDLINSLLFSNDKYIEQYRPLPTTFEDFYKLGIERTKVKKHWIKLINDLELDIILGPGYEDTAPSHDLYKNPAYTSMWNLVDFPSLVIPYGKTEKEVDIQTFKHGQDELQKDDKYAKEGIPGHIQLSYRTLEDEKVLKIGELIDKVLNKQLD